MSCSSLWWALINMKVTALHVHLIRPHTSTSWVLPGDDHFIPWGQVHIPQFITTTTPTLVTMVPALKQGRQPRIVIKTFCDTNFYMKNLRTVLMFTGQSLMSALSVSKWNSHKQPWLGHTAVYKGDNACLWGGKLYLLNIIAPQGSPVESWMKPASPHLKEPSGPSHLGHTRLTRALPTIPKDLLSHRKLSAQCRSI